MNRKLIIPALIFFIATSFTYPAPPPQKTLHLFYVDNSNSKTYGNFGAEMFNILEARVDSINNDKFGTMAFFVANGERTEFASNYRGAKNIISRLSNASTNAPNSFYDRSFIVESLVSTDLASIKGVQLHLYLSEASLLSDFIGGNNAGFFINSLPKDLQYLIECSDENIAINIYYPSESKKIKEAQLKSFTEFPNVHKGFSSSIKFEILPL